VRGALGLCTALCDCERGCEHPDMGCEDAGEGALEVLGRAGFCIPAAEVTAPLRCDPTASEG
jgi:hypothetical protein